MSDEAAHFEPGVNLSISSSDKPPHDKVKNAPAVLALAVCVAGCGNGANSTASTPSQPTPAPPSDFVDFVARASDFECLQNWDKVRNIRFTNKLGHLADAHKLAENPESGKQYPVGTIIQLFPGEAMVKRGPTFDPANHDWEYFELDVSASGTSIAKRGRDEIINRFGGQCFGCHKAAIPFDFICEENHGCARLPIDDAAIAMLQDSDPRCKP